MIRQNSQIRSIRFIGALLAAGWLAFAASARAADRPNVLWLIADDHAAYVYGAYGNPIIRTPNLDRLATEGMRFDRAYCNSPVCTASRQSFLTGRYPRTIGVTQLRTALPGAETTVAELLGAAGYATGAIGKMHFNSNLRHGFDLIVGRGSHQRSLRDRGPLPLPEGVAVLGRWRPFRSPAREWLNAGAIPFAARDADMAATFLTEKAESFLLAERDQPFFLMVSLHQPHSPFNFPVEYQGKYDPALFDPPEPGPGDDWQVPKIFRELRREEKQGITAAYYTAVEYMDEKMGRVLAALEASGEAENTLVVYIGDHGYFLGHHGRIEKHSMFEPAIRAPLVVRYPGHVESGTASDAQVEFIDILPTLLEYAEVAAPESVQGRSLTPLLEGRAEEHRDFVIVEYSENEEAMIRDKQWKLIYVTGARHRQDGYEAVDPLPGRKIMLFDTAADPGEVNNLADRPEHAGRLRAMAGRLADHMRRTSRRPELIPQDLSDPYDLLDFCLKPRDIEPPKA